MGKRYGKLQGRRGPRRKGRATKDAEAIGITSAAEAEYLALLAGLTHAYELGLARMTARSDSRLLIAHVNGERHIRNPRLLALKADIADRRMQIGSVLFEWIPATANAEAHRLVAGVLDSARG